MHRLKKGPLLPAGIAAMTILAALLWVLVLVGIAQARAVTLTRTNPTTDVSSCAVTVRVRYPGPGARWRVQGSNCVVTRPTTGVFSVAFDRDCQGHTDPRALDAGYDFAQRTITLQPGRPQLPHWHGVIFRYGEVFHALASWREEDGLHRVGVLKRGPKQSVNCVVAVFKDFTPGPIAFPDGTPVYNNDEILDWGYFPRGLKPVVLPRANPEP